MPSRSSASISSSRSLGVLGVYSHLLKTFLIASNAVFLVLGVNSPSSPKPSDERIYEPAGSEPWLNEKLLDFSSVFSRILRSGEPSLEVGWFLWKNRCVLNVQITVLQKKDTFLILANASKTHPKLTEASEIPSLSERDVTVIGFF